MSDIKVSIFGSCNRPHLWNMFYDALRNNTVNFEVIFVGNVEPKFELPNNFHFVYSNVKPNQCSQAAALMSSGEVMILVADDCYFSPFALDILYSEYKKENDYKCMVAPKFIGVVHPPKDDSEIQKIADASPLDNPDVHLIYNDFTSPRIHVGGVMSKDFFNELGGFDKRFIIGQADIDLQIRAQMAGGRIIYTDKAWLAERKDWCPNWQNGISKNYSSTSSEILRSLWHVNNKFTEIRTDIFTPYEENDALLIESQGPKGQWS